MFLDKERDCSVDLNRKLRVKVDKKIRADNPPLGLVSERGVKRERQM